MFVQRPHVCKAVSMYVIWCINTLTKHELWILPLVGLHSDITWHHCMWRDLPHLLPLYMHIGSGKFLEVAKAWDEGTTVATWLFKVCTQVQTGRFYHMRNISVYLGQQEGCGESLCLPDKENLPGHPPLLSAPKKVENSENKAGVTLCILSFSSR